METQKKDAIIVRDNKNNKEWYSVDNLLIDNYSEAIGSNALSVYVLLCRYANKKQMAFPSIETICKKLIISKPTVIKSIKILQYFNMIHKKREGQRRNNTYTLVNKVCWINDYDKNDFNKIINKKNIDIDKVK